MAESRSIEYVLSMKDNLSGGLEKASSKLKGFEGRTKQFGDSLGGLASKFKSVSIVAAGVLGTLGLFVRQSVKDFQVEELALTRLRAGLKNYAETNKLAAESVDAGVRSLSEYAAQLQKTTGFGDEAIISAQGMLATFQLSAEEIKTITPRLLDMGAALEKTSGQQADLQQLAIAMGKAIGPGGTAGALRRYGVALTEAQEKQLDAATGGEKLKLIMEILDQNFKGTAEAAGQKLPGRLRILNAELSDLREKIGAVVMPILVQFMEFVLKIAKSVEAWAEKHPELAKWLTIISVSLIALLAALTPVLLALKVLLPVIGAIAGVLSGPLVIAIGAAVAGAILLIKHWDEVKAFFIALPEHFIKLWEQIKGAWKAGVEAVVAFFKFLPENIGFALGLLFQKLINFATIQVPEFVRQTIAWFRELPAQIGPIAAGLWEATKAGFVTFGQALVQWARDTIEAVMNFFRELPGKIVERFKAGVEGIKGFLRRVGEGFEAGREAAGRQSGGFVRAGRPYIVGERGPELFMPRSHGTILPNVGTQNVSINVTVNDRADLLAVLRAIDQHLGNKSVAARFGVTG